MPIEYRIDHARRVVLARGVGAFTEQDVFGYQREVWSRPEVAGYNELVDMTDVTEIPFPSAAKILELVQLSVAADPPSTPSKFAIIAPQDLAFGLGRMHQAFRGADQRSTKEVGVFRNRAEALAFLGIQEEPPPQGAQPVAP